MIYRRMPALLRIMPDAVQRHLLYFESEIEDAVREFSALLAPGSRVLDAGAGEAQYACLLEGHRYCAIDLGIGDPEWSYRQLDAIAALEYLPFRDSTFDGCMNIVTLEHVTEPGRVVAELARVLRPGGRLLLVTPLEWEEHQQPHDYYRYTRYGVEHLAGSAGLVIETLKPSGGFFRLLARRLLNGAQFFPGPLSVVALALAAVPALLLPFLDGLDRKRNFTLGHLCVARKP